MKNNDTVIYCGAVIGKNKQPLDRFNEHIQGKGGKFLYEAIIKGNLDVSNIYIQVESYHRTYLETFEKERELILHHRTYNKWGSGYNGNCGGGLFIGKHTRCYKFKENGHCYLMPVDSTYQKTEIVDRVEDVVGISSQNWRSLSCLKTDIKIRSCVMVGDLSGYKCLEFIKGLFGEDVAIELLLSILEIKDFDVNINWLNQFKKSFGKNGNQWCPVLSKISYYENKTYTLKCPESLRLKTSLKLKGRCINVNEGWLKGRQNFRERVGKKQFTNAEIKGRVRTTKAVIEDWKIKSKEERLNKTQSGRDAMNIQVECEHCKRIINGLGNYKRWHGDNCKNKG
jgi:hypothetical protein